MIFISRLDILKRGIIFGLVLNRKLLLLIAIRYCVHCRVIEREKSASASELRSALIEAFILILLANIDFAFVSPPSERKTLRAYEFYFNQKVLIVSAAFNFCE